MRIETDRALCIGSGECVLASPKFFDQDDDGIVILLDDVASDPADIRAIESAVHACPARVITWHER
jgi:ferredoxin